RAIARALRGRSPRWPIRDGAYGARATRRGAPPARAKARRRAPARPVRRWRNAAAPRRTRRGKPAPPATARAGRRSLRSPLRDVRGEAAQRAEDAQVVAVVLAQLEPVAPRDDEGDLQDVDGIEAEAFLVERRVRIDPGCRDLEIERRDHQLGHLLQQPIIQPGPAERDVVDRIGHRFAVLGAGPFVSLWAVNRRRNHSTRPRASRTRSSRRRAKT